jgi:hypothetical protein
VTDQQTNKGHLKTILALGSALLVLLAVVLLILLRPPPEEPAESTTTTRARPTPPPPTRTPARAVLRQPAVSTGAVPTTDAGAASSEDAGTSLPLRSVAGVHSAPPATPAEIRNETDPVRKARLEKMHALATARARASQLRRRARLLQNSLTRAREDNSWSEEKQLRAERNLKELEEAIRRAERNVEVVGRRVGKAIKR